MKFFATILLAMCCHSAFAAPTSTNSEATSESELEVLMRSRRQTQPHNGYEIIAQSICTNLATKSNRGGWIYAVQRTCSSSNTETCVQICGSPYLHVQDIQTAYSNWGTLGAFHVYGGRPSSRPGTRNAPRQGLKVYYSSTYHQGGSCGPNWCCCHAS